MAQFRSRLKPGTAEFTAAAAQMRGHVDELKRKLVAIGQGGDDASRERHIARGKLLVRDRIKALLDPGSPWLELSPLAAYEMYENAVPAAGIVTGIGRVMGRECVVIANDAPDDGVQIGVTGPSTSSAAVAV